MKIMTFCKRMSNITLDSFQTSLVTHTKKLHECVNSPDIPCVVKMAYFCEKIMLVMKQLRSVKPDLFIKIHKPT